jgi:hypothetical protein
MTAIRMRITDDDLKDIKPDSPLYVRVVAELCEFDEESPYRKYAQDRLQVDGDLEFDDDAAVSLGADDGAYVMGWKWVSDEDVREAGYLEDENNASATN